MLTDLFHSPVPAPCSYYLFTAVTNDGTGYWATGPSLVTCDDLSGVRYLPHGESGEFAARAALDTGCTCN